jgi:hypothetical protein
MKGKDVDGMPHDNALACNTRTVIRVAVLPLGGCTLIGTAALLPLRGLVGLIIGIGLITHGAGSISGVLLHVTWQWRQGVVFDVRFADGFCACMIVGASVIRGIVMMGDLSITLCSSLHCSISVILCCSLVGGSVNRPWIRVARSLSKHQP